MTVAGNPFVRYRELLESYASARSRGWTDRRFVEVVEQLDEQVAAVDGRGFRVTPLTPEPALARAVGLDGGELWVKNDTVNVSGSHKGRHLFGLLLHLCVDEVPAGQVLAIASCGNAALAAAVVARAAGRPLRVFIPTDASSVVVDRLDRLDAQIVVCPRIDGVAGDPCYHAFRHAVGEGAIAFTGQGSDAPATIDGGRTIAFELAEQLADSLGPGATLDRLVVQVGGGALAAACGRGLATAVEQGWLARLPKLCAVQTRGAYPLIRAWTLLNERLPSPPAAGEARHWRDYAADHTGELMWPWETTPHSIAHGIVDDVTYDWLDVIEALVASGGSATIVDEADLIRANQLAREHTSIAVDHTGTAGLAALPRVAAAGERVAVLFTGAARTPDPMSAR